MKNVCNPVLEFRAFFLFLMFTFFLSWCLSPSCCCYSRYFLLLLDDLFPCACFVCIFRSKFNIELISSKHLVRVWFVFVYFYFSVCSFLGWSFMYLITFPLSDNLFSTRWSVEWRLTQRCLFVFHLFFLSCSRSSLSFARTLCCRFFISTVFFFSLVVLLFLSSPFPVINVFVASYVCYFMLSFFPF